MGVPPALCVVAAAEDLVAVLSNSRAPGDASIISQADFDPSKDSLLLNAARLFRHTATKGVQAGGIVGLAAVAPAMAFMDVKEHGKIDVPRVSRW